MSQSQSNTADKKAPPPGARIKGIRFLRDVRFPRFSMRAGELWEHGFDSRHGLGGYARDYFAAVQSGDDRFLFAGGQCLLIDVEPVYQTAEDIERQSRIEALLRSAKP